MNVSLDSFCRTLNSLMKVNELRRARGSIAITPTAANMPKMNMIDVNAIFAICLLD